MFAETATLQKHYVFSILEKCQNAQLVKIQSRL